MTYTIDETYTDEQFTAAGAVAGVFGTPRRYESITIHHFGAFGQRPADVVDFFINRNWTTSAHFVCSAAKIWCLVSPANAAWAAGNAYGNATSIHIECPPEATDADYAAVAWLVSFLRENYGANLPLKPHNAWTATACPGKWDLARVDALARGAAAPAPQPAPAPAPAGKYVPDPHWIVDPGDTLGKIAKHFGTGVGRLAAYNGIDNPDAIRVGELIWPPTGRDTWTVDPGDTLGKIAKHYGISVDRICNANGINTPDRIAVGVRLQIPA
jgi:N-acetylmuramoyl-L-alanine amidase